MENVDFQVVLANKRYDYDEIVDTIINSGAISVIPPKKIEKYKDYNKELYKKRYKIESLSGFFKAL